MICQDHPKTVYWIQFKYNYFCGVYCDFYIVRYQTRTRKILIRMAASFSQISYTLDFVVRKIVIISHCSQIRGFKLSHVFRRYRASADSKKNSLEVRENRYKSYVIPYILESNPHPFYSFRGLKNQMRIRIACGLHSRSRVGFWRKKEKIEPLYVP
jgi:hypothetical protein